MAFIVMGHRGSASLFKREAGLGAIQRLDLTLLIGAEHQGMLWRIEIQAHHVMEFLKEPRILTELEGAHQVGLQPMGFPDSSDQGSIGAEMVSQRPEGPVRGRRWGRVQGGRHNTLLLGLADRRRAPPARRVLSKAWQPMGREPLPPQPDRLATGSHREGDRLIVMPLGREQHNLGSKHEAHGGRSPKRPLL